MISIIAYWLIHCEDNTLDEEKTDEEINSFLKTKSLSKDGEHPITDKQFNALSPKYKRILYTAITRTHNLCDVSKIDVKDVTNIDLVTYSFPCQDISNRGKKLGFDAGSGTRSALVWKVGELLDNMKSNISSCGKMPKFLLMENVKAIVSDNNISNFNVWIEKLNSLGYFSKYFLIDAKDFGAPQSRNRCFMISVFVGEDEEYKKKIEKFFEENVIEKIDKDLKLEDVLRLDYNNPQYKNEADAVNPNNTKSRQKIFNLNKKLLDENGNFEKSCTCITKAQDRQTCSGTIFYPNTREGKAQYRFLTPREQVMLMGFEEKDYQKLIDFNNNVEKVFSVSELGRLAGNSIVVQCLDSIFTYISKIDKI